MTRAAAFDAILFDIGGTLVVEAPPGTPTADLRVELFPYVLADVTDLARRFRIGAVTNTAVMTETDVRALLQPSGLSARLEVVVTSADVGAAKPDPRPIARALEQLGLSDPARVLYVGNDPVDRQAAAAAGTAFAGTDGSTRIREVVERAATRRGDEPGAGRSGYR